MPGLPYNQVESNSTVINESTDIPGLKLVFHPFVNAHLKTNTDLSSLISHGIYTAGFIANVILVCYIIKYRRYRTPIFGIIMSLAVADGNNCIASIVWNAARAPYVLGPDWVCNLSSFLTPFSVTASNYNVTAISVIRFYQLVFPLTAHVKLTSKWVAKMCSFVWINALSVGVYWVFIHRTVELEDSRGDFKVCQFVGKQPRVASAVAGIWVTLCPLIITVVLHLVKHAMLRKQGASAQLSGTGDTHGHVRESTDTRAVLIVIIVFIVTTTPMAGYHLAKLVSGYQLAKRVSKVNSTIMPILADLLNKIFLLNSVINPFIYVFAAHTVRRDILAMLRCKSPENKHGT